MIFVKAFILGGILCVIGQLFYRLTKFSVPTVLSIALAAGGLITALGWMTQIVGWGDAGMILMIIDSGEAAYWWMTDILTTGSFASCAQHVVLLLCVFVFSALIGGPLYYKKYFAQPTISEETNEKIPV